ncbi:MAG: nucleotidyltransferase domain-containing protein [Anaerolinea sp.]|nr:nucleotidyltransferase domain-containing protein [Anaerolinea sp.]
MLYLPPEKAKLVGELLTLLTVIPGVRAVVLGGSWARRSARPDSDVDLALYYHEDRPFEIDRVRAVAAHVNVTPSPVVTGFYEWGAWVNGGAWLTTRAGKVDFLYRNIEHVERTLRDAQAGSTQIDYAQQPTFGFHSTIYLAETHDCDPLYDPDNIIAGLKARLPVYPPALKTALIGQSLWGAEFTLYHLRGFAARGDIYNAVGCIARVFQYLTHVLFAFNETYFRGDKGAVELIAAFPRKPEGYLAAMNALLAHPGASAEELSRSADAVERLWRAVKELVDS